jgi:hypothetical protein
MTSRNSKGQFVAGTVTDPVISLRDLIAIEALKILLVGNEEVPNWCSERSYEIADAMIYARNM